MYDKIRNINLKELLGKDLTVEELNYKEAVLFLNETLISLNLYTSLKLQNWIFYGKSKDEIIYEYNIHFKIFIYSHNDITRYLKTEFKFNSDYINYLVEKHIANKLGIEPIHIYEANISGVIS